MPGIGTVPSPPGLRSSTHTKCGLVPSKGAPHRTHAFDSFSRSASVLRLKERRLEYASACGLVRPTRGLRVLKPSHCHTTHPRRQQQSSYPGHHTYRDRPKPSGTSDSGCFERGSPRWRGYSRATGLMDRDHSSGVCDVARAHARISQDHPLRVLLDAVTRLEKLPTGPTGNRP